MKASRRVAHLLWVFTSACSSNSSPDDGGRGATGTPGADSGLAASQDGAAPGPSSWDGAIPANDGGAGGGTPLTCARADLTVTRTIPTVWLLVDGSGSMGDGFTGIATASRWSVLREALLDPTTGLVAKLQGSVSFGLMVYDGGNSPPGVYLPGVCPHLVVVPPALTNLAMINNAYPAIQSLASTPTHYALEELAKRIADAAPSTPGPSYVVLATDGKPNLCDFHDGVPANELTDQEAVRTVTGLASKGTKLFAISMAGGDAALQAHLEDVARAGATGEGAFSPTSKDGLVDALQRIIGGAVSCDVTVDGMIVAGKECAGDVKLNGQPLACNTADGYRVREDRASLQLTGAACATLQTSPQAQLSASFACEDVILR
jgi:hypothetical protein